MKNLKKLGLKIGAVSAVVVSGVANATVEESISSAITSGQTNYTTVVVGLIGLAAIGFGLRAIVSAMR